MAFTKDAHVAVLCLEMQFGKIVLVDKDNLHYGVRIDNDDPHTIRAGHIELIHIDWLRDAAEVRRLVRAAAKDQTGSDFAKLYDWLTPGLGGDDDDNPYKFALDFEQRPNGDIAVFADKRLYGVVRHDG